MNGDKVKDILYNPVSLWLSVLSILVIIIGAVLFIVYPQAQLETKVALQGQAIEVISKNHLNKIGLDIDALEEKDDEHDKLFNAINIKLERILTILDPSYY